MSQDIVKHLRDWAGNYEEGSFDTEAGLMLEAAAEVERLRSYVIRLTSDSDALRAELEWLRQRRNASPCSKR